MSRSGADKFLPLLLVGAGIGVGIWLWKRQQATVEALAQKNAGIRTTRVAISDPVAAALRGKSAESIAQANAGIRTGR